MGWGSKAACLWTAAAVMAYAGAALAAFGQPADERAAQRALPKSTSAVWVTLRHARIGEDPRRGLYTVSFPGDVKALAGRTVTVTGFMLPLDTTAKTQHFLLAKYTPVCFFCPPGEPNEVVEVTTRAGVPLTSRMLTVSGPLTLIDNGEKGLFFQINGAAVH